MHSMGQQQHMMGQMAANPMAGTYAPTTANVAASMGMAHQYRSTPGAMPGSSGGVAPEASWMANDPSRQANLSRNASEAPSKQQQANMMGRPGTKPTPLQSGLNSMESKSVPMGATSSSVPSGMGQQMTMASSVDPSSGAAPPQTASN